MTNIYYTQIRNCAINTAFHMKTIYMTLKKFRKPIINKNKYLMCNKPDMSTGRDTRAKN